MKNMLLLALALLAAAPAALAQTPGVGIGTTAPNASAALDIVSSSKGALLPRLTSAQRAAIASPAPGLLVFQTDGTPGFYYNAGTAAVPDWQQLATASGAAVTASNGLTKTGASIGLGGTLTGNTTLALNNYNLGLTGGNVGIGVVPTGAGLQVSTAEKPAVSGSGGVFLSGGATGNPNIELRGTNGSAYLDFVNDLTTDYASRILSTSAGLALHTGGNATARLLISPTGTVSIAGLAGSGTRMVTATASGALGSAAVPADAQQLSLSGSTLSLTNGGSVSLPSGDNLGNHTATQALNLGSNQLVGNGGTAGLSISSAGSVGMGTTTPAASALLDMSSTTRGFLPPRLSQPQRDAIGSPATGLLIYNTDSNKLNVWNGTSWTEAYTTTDLAPVAGGTTFNYTGGPQTYTVPAGITQLQVTAAGAQGGDDNRGIGGGGATVTTTLAVVPGETLNLYVGGAGARNFYGNTNYYYGGGYNGGGSAAYYGSGGGGATDIRRGGSALTDRVVVAGGGGGCGGDYPGLFGGSGGAPIGGDGYNGPNSGGQQTGGYNNGALGQGAPSAMSGGGGGGYYGGGASPHTNTQGGGGGSSWVDPSTTTGTSYAGGNRRGHGYLSLLPLTVPATSPAVSGGNVQMLQLTQTQRDALTPLTAGLLIYNLTTGRLNFYTGVGWVEFFSTAETGTQIGAGQTYYATGAMQTYTVPAGVTQLRIDARGGSGGHYLATAASGKGARVQATLAVVPGQVLNLFVGGQGQNFENQYTAANYTSSARAGGYNGGGNAGYSGGAGGGGGGGATDIRLGGTALTDRVLVAAGGGGAGGSWGHFGGAGGAPVGSNGGATSGSQAGAGATQSAGGAGGAGDNTNSGRGGGGGGGYFGGGVGWGGGGGGGSSYVGAGVSDVQYSVLTAEGGGSLTLAPGPQYAAPALDGSNFVSLPAASLTGVVDVTNLPGLTSSASGTNRTISLGPGNSTTFSVGDDLGSHTATQNLNLGANALVGNGGSTGLSVASSGAVTTAGSLTTGGAITAGGNVQLGPNALVGSGGTGLSITSAGSVGIGVAATQALDVNGGILARGANTVSTQGAYLQWNRSGGDGETYLLNQRGGGGANAGIRFGSASPTNVTTEYARFTFNGNFGIGTITPSQLLDVNGGILARGSGLISNQGAHLQWNRSGGGGETWLLNQNGGGLGGIRFGQSNSVGSGSNTIAEWARFDENGNMGIGTTSPSQKLTVIGNICASGGLNCSSDGRYKRDVTEVQGALASVLQLRGVTYYWKQAEFPEKQFPARRQLGFIAQEIEPYYPEMVTTDADGYKSVDYARLTPVLVEALKEQQRQIEALKARATQAEARAAAATAALETFEARLRRLEAQGAEQARR